MNRFTLLPLSLLFVGQICSANIIPTLTNVTPNGINFNWNYQVDVSLDQNVNTGNYFTIYDFGPIIGPSVIPAGWTLTTQNLGLTPALVSPADSASVLNLTLTRDGGTIVGPAGVGTFTFTSANSIVATGTFAALATRNNGQQSGSTIANVGSVSVPSSVPEPATSVFVGIGLIAWPIIRRLRQNRLVS